MLSCRAPPPPVAALLSPVLWLLNSPDRFDMWSAGVVLLQMAFPSMRTDTSLIAFNKYVHHSIAPPPPPHPSLLAFYWP